MIVQSNKKLFTALAISLGFSILILSWHYLDLSILSVNQEKKQLMRTISELHTQNNDLRLKLLNQQDLEYYSNMLSSYSNRLFSVDELRNNSMFGKIIQGYIHKNNLKIIRMTDLSPGYQFILEGEILKILSFLHGLYMHEKIIIITNCSMVEKRINFWEISIDIFPGYDE